MEISYAIAIILVVILQLVMIIKFFQLTSDVRQLRNFFLYPPKEKQPIRLDMVKKEQNEEEQLMVEKLKSKIKPHEIIVKIKATEKVEIWKLTDWDDIKEENKNKFEILYKA